MFQAESGSWADAIISVAKGRSGVGGHPGLGPLGRIITGRHGPNRTWHRLRHRVLANLRHIPRSTIRVCGCCRRRTLIVSLSEGEEFRFCVRCRANLRYEMLASYIHAHYELLE